MPVPFQGPTRRYARHITRLSTGLALVSDAAMLTLGGALKRREKLSGRFADVLSFLYLASAVLKRFEEQGRPQEDEPLLRWACAYCLHQAEKALVVILKNLPSRFFGWLLGGLVFPPGATSIRRATPAVTRSPVSCSRLRWRVSA